ncbi:MAG: cell envelope integrity protein CreD [Bacteroidetes bacterium]|nr:cell envelope integrity protein CreD [Bacteroidota bacterium]
MENIVSAFWNGNKIILKSFLIGVLVLLLLIPTFFIQGLVTERKQRQVDAVTEISSRWAPAQTVTGPVIGIPYTEMVTGDKDAHEVKRWAYFLPAKLSIRSRLMPETRYRGIYQAIVYTTELQIQGSYDSIGYSELGIPREKLLWNEAAIFFDISDVQGLKEDMIVHLQNGSAADIEMVPAKFATDQFKSALSASLPQSLLASNSAIAFSSTVSLKGTGSLLFVPVGRETKVEAASTWATPSFTGSVLPDIRSVRDSGFIADWKVLALNRKFPQQWKQGSYDLDASAFGVSLIVPVDAYQQTTRSVKYAILLIGLTFTAFFLIEWIYSRPIHSLQYLLVGFALCLFYTLLLSLAEYTGFNTAYGVAAVATIGLIGWYVGSMLRSSRISLFVVLLLAVQYGFVFTLIQLQDYALLMGSIGLFITLALVMYFSRKIKWNGQEYRE